MKKGGAGIWILIILLIVILAVVFISRRGSNVVPSDEIVEEDEMTEEVSETTYNVIIRNISEDQPLSPGVYVVHTSEASLDFTGEVAPSELEPLAEYGDNQAFASLVSGLPGVVDVITVDAPIMPGEEATFTLSAENGADLYISGIQMAVASNDGIALVDSVALNGTAQVVQAINLDAGTEENSELGSGFEGGQPDPEQGEANIDNGTATDPAEPVSSHEQLVDPILELEISPVL